MWAQTHSQGGFLDLGPVQEWVADAPCVQTDPDAFYPEKSQPNRAAKSVCGSCPVREECLEYALDNGERHGVWGGLSERERWALQRQRRVSGSEAA